MTPETRLARIVAALEEVGVRCLVMGGHAVRYYGLMRNTNDFDLQLGPDAWDDLPDRLRKTTLFHAQPLFEGASWRENSFRRFQIGRLSDGGEEWLEFWRTNHLLAPFHEAYARREMGKYGGDVLPFMELADLIRSKETERPKDWQDVYVLEEVLDARRLAAVRRKELPLSAALAQLRSRRGFESYLQEGFLGETESIRQALSQSLLPATQAFLLPYATDAQLPPTIVPMEPVIVNRLRQTVPASSLHLALVESVRRQYQHSRRLADKSDKEAIRAAQREQGT